MLLELKKGEFVATCKCGKKIGWTSVECPDCAKESAKKRVDDQLELFREKLPNIYSYCQRYEGIGFEFREAFLDDLTADIEILEFAGGLNNLILTPTSIMKWEMTMSYSRVKQKEIIPLGTVTGFEASPPTKSVPQLWKFRITRAGNTDEVYIADGPNVRPFIEAVTAALSGGGAKSQAPQQSAAEKIKSLAELRDSGILTEEEFNQKKAELLRDF